MYCSDRESAPFQRPGCTSLEDGGLDGLSSEKADVSVSSSLPYSLDDSKLGTRFLDHRPRNYRKGGALGSRRVARFTGQDSSGKEPAAKSRLV